VPTKKPWGELTDKQKQLVVDGSGEYKGIRGWFRRLERKLSHACARIAGAYRAYLMCPDAAAPALNRTLCIIASPAKYRPSQRPQASAQRCAFLTSSAVRRDGSGIEPDSRRDSPSLGYLLGVGLEYLTSTPVAHAVGRRVGTLT
jgi:excinuclease ABC subunit A